jgi:hypothetical protein
LRQKVDRFTHRVIAAKVEAASLDELMFDQLVR